MKNKFSLWHKPDFSDPTIYSIIGANLFTIFLVLINFIDYKDILWIYWGESVIIGIFNFLRMYNLESPGIFSRVGEAIASSQNSNKVVELFGGALKNSHKATAIFFAFHYGMFHFVYMQFIFFFTWSSPFSVGVLLSIGTYFISHLYSYITKYPEYKKHMIDVGKLMSMPYFRIFPMHLAIIFGGMLGQMLNSPFEIMQDFNNIQINSSKVTSFENINQIPKSFFGNTSLYMALILLVLKNFADIFMHSSEYKEYSEYKVDESGK